MELQIVAIYGRDIVARHANGELWRVMVRGRQQRQQRQRDSSTDRLAATLAVGDHIHVTATDADQAWLDEVLPRHNLFYRQDHKHAKAFAANVDVVVLMLAVAPSYASDLFQRALIAAALTPRPNHPDLRVQCLVIMNKTDLLATPEDQEILQQRLRTDFLTACRHEDLQQADDWQPLWLSISRHPDQARQKLLPYLAKQRALLIGPSGVGKSSLLNLLCPEAEAFTQSISRALNSGKHTTTTCQIYQHRDLTLIDSPGFQHFGLNHISRGELDEHFADIVTLGHDCQFRNCQHQQEPGCMVQAAIERGQLSRARFERYCSLR